MPKILRTKRSCFSLTLALLLISDPIVGLSQDHQDTPYTATEHAAFLAADLEKNPQIKIKLLDEFSTKYPDSALLSEVVRDYYLTFFTIKNYPRTIEYADKYLVLEIDSGDRLEALQTRAQAFLAGCSDPAFQTPESYTAARSAAVEGLRSVARIPIADIQGPVSGGLPPREHEEALFYTVARIAVAGLKGNKDDACASEKIEVRNIRLFSRSKAKEYAEFQEFREAKGLELFPSSEFEAICDVKGEPDLWAGDFLLWTTVEFLVAPAMRRYEEVDSDAIASEGGWATLVGVADLKPIPIYSLGPGQTRRVVIKGFDLKKVVSAFPIGNPGNLWPWLIRLEIHVQDRNGKQIGSAERIVRLFPDSVREGKATDGAQTKIN
jgi:hypothetical protein